ncbi:MAG: cytosine deaminase [Synechocystis sp.]|nr:cytosine deaminase [Synechocystis sp.]
MRYDPHPHRFISPNTSHYWLENAHILPYLVADPSSELVATTSEGLALAHLEIKNGQLTQIIPAIDLSPRLPTIPRIDLAKRIIFPRFVDIHTHLDKGHIWERSPNPDGTFAGALHSVEQDRAQYFRAEDVYRRMEFALQCSYAHGTAAIRTHLDAVGEQGHISFDVFEQLRQEWGDRLILQGVCLVSMDYYLTPAGEALADRMADQGHALGGFAYGPADLTAPLTRLLELAQERGLDLDLHVDETDDDQSWVLHQVAALALKLGFTGRIICGHCCSLDRQSPSQVQQTLALVKQARMAITSLPLCNLYLQGRHHRPSWRGITRVHDIQRQGIPLAFASDNCRDPFFAYGDHDGFEVLTQSIRIGQLDRPYDQWCASVNKIPAQLMGLGEQGVGQLKTGNSADFVIFNARYFSELFSRPQGDRLIVGQGKPLPVTLPDYQTLDDLMSP